MKFWKIKAIKAGTIKTTIGDTIRYKSLDVPLEINSWFVAADDGEHKVLIDTGIDGNSIEWIRNNIIETVYQNETQHPITALKRETGWSAEDVDIIINTHLHYDHCGCNKYFQNAKIYVQRKEFESAFHPVKAHESIYAQRFFDKNSIFYFRWNFLEGEKEILPGLICLPTPGHTYGHQSVLILTENGTVCVAGDAVPTVRNINENLETGVSVDSSKVIESMDAIRIRADYIITGHEPNIKENSFASFSKLAG